MKFLVAITVALGLTISASAQQPAKTTGTKPDKSDRDALAASSLYVVSAKAGGVNYVSGRVYAVSQSGKQKTLIKGDQVESGDTVMTDNTGRAEILLNPGSYIRLAGDTVFKFESSSLEDMALKINRGNAIVEFLAVGDFSIPVKTPDSVFHLVKSGVYRIDVAGDTSNIAVWKGKVRLNKNEKNAVTLKGGQETLKNGGQVAVQKFDRDVTSEFDNWSKERAKQLATANAALTKRDMRRSLMTSFVRDRWNPYGNGLWIFSPTVGYSYLPFYYGISSPYGYDFNRSLFSYSLPNVIYNTVVPTYANTNNDNRQYNPYPQNPQTGTGNINSGGRISPSPSYSPDVGAGGRISTKGDQGISRPGGVQIQRPIDQ